MVNSGYLALVLFFFVPDSPVELGDELLCTVVVLLISCPDPHDEPINSQLCYVLAPITFF